MNEVAALRERVDFLEEENRQLRSELRGVDADELYAACMAAFKLTKLGVKLLVGLMHRPICNREYLFAAMYDDRLEIDLPEDMKTVDVYICKVRKALKPHGEFVESVWGTGYKITEENKQAIRRIIGLDQGPADA